MNTSTDQRERDLQRHRRSRFLLTGLAALALSSAVQAQETTTAAVAVEAPYKETIPRTGQDIPMVPISGGSVEMTNEAGETVAVEVGDLWVSDAEITWDLFDIFVFGFEKPDAERGEGNDTITRPSKPYLQADRGFGHAGYPALSISFKSAQEFCSWLSDLTGRHYRLPTEAEWRHIYLSGGNADSRPEDIGWSKKNARWKTHAVRSLKGDSNGVYDLSGNVGEWVVGLDGKPYLVGGSYQDPIEAVGLNGRKVPTPDWNATDPQIPKSVWWLADAPFAGFRIVCDPNPRLEPAATDGDDTDSGKEES